MSDQVKKQLVEIGIFHNNEIDKQNKGVDLFITIMGSDEYHGHLATDLLGAMEHNKLPNIDFHF